MIEFGTFNSEHKEDEFVFHLFMKNRVASIIYGCFCEFLIVSGIHKYGICQWVYIALFYYINGFYVEKSVFARIGIPINQMEFLRHHRINSQYDIEIIAFCFSRLYTSIMEYY